MYTEVRESRIFRCAVKHDTAIDTPNYELKQPSTAEAHRASESVVNQLYPIMALLQEHAERFNFL